MVPRSKASEPPTQIRTTTRWPGFAVALLIALALGATSPASLLPGLAASPAPAPQNQATGQADISATALEQIAALLTEKASRTPAQQKIDSQLLYASKMAKGQAIAAGVAALEVDLPYTSDGRVVVDVRAAVTDALLDELRALGAEIVDASAVYGSVRLQAALDRIESIAALPAVIFVQPKQQAMTSRLSGVAGSPAAGAGSHRAPRLRRRLDRAALAAALQRATDDVQKRSAGTVVETSGKPDPSASGTGQGSQTSEGDATHRAFAARGTFHVNGTGVKIGVLSDGVTNLAASQALGDLGSVTVLPGQTGSGDEGTAMLEIVHDLAPGAQLYFATAFNSITSFAQNIRDLRTAGCDIIVDDVFYYVETPFQDGQSGGPVSTTNGGVVIQAVRDVTAVGALYFSSAGNSGNLDAGTSGTWEGDFLDGGATAAPLPLGARVHSFGAQTFNSITTAGNLNNLYWSDPLGASSNDYDLFRLDSTGASVLASSTNLQNGTQDPYEQHGTGGSAGNRLVIVKSSAAAGRFLHLGTNRGRLSIATAGETHGHADTTAATSFSVAATPAVGPSPNPFNASNVVETFSSDGPRRIFFNQDASAITPGNFSSTGGQVLNKPDLTAADGVSVTGVGGFGSPFFGTSAAAPHAAAIAGLVKSANLSLTAAQVKSALLGSAIDIQAAGIDRDSGAGIVMAYTAMGAVATGTAFVTTATVTPSENPGNGDGWMNPGEGAKVNVQLTNLGVSSATAISATLTTSTPGVTVTLPGTSTYPDLAPGAFGTNATPFAFTLASSASCALTIDFTLTLSYSGGGPDVSTFQVETASYTITTTLDTTAPASSPGIAATTGLQTSRVNRNGVVSTCAAPKANPGLLAGGTGTRRYDAYAFNTCAGSVASCATVTVTQPGTIPLFTVANAPSFDPANPSTNYKADPGASSASMVYSFPVSAGVNPLTLVVHEVNSTGGLGTSYTLKLTGVCAGACATPNQVPVALAHHVVVRNASGIGSASINNGSFDGDGDGLTITQSPPGPYSMGTTSVLLTVTDPKGATSQATATVTVATTSFTDNPLVVGATLIKAVHIAELRARVDGVRVDRGLAPFSWTGLPPTPSVIIQAIHITQLRQALADAYAAASIPAPTYTDASLAAGTVIKAVHLAEIRSAILGIE